MDQGLFITFDVNPNVNDRSINLPKNIIKLGKSAFYQNNKLRKISFNEKLQIIEEESFKDCLNLETVYFPLKIELNTIPNRCFENCQKLEYISIPSSVDHIKSKAFRNCLSINVLTIPNGIVSIEHDAFEGWKSSQEIVVYKDYGSFSNCKAKVVNLGDKQSEKDDSIRSKESGNRYFAVKCKCGHVSRRYYIPITFGVITRNRKEAAKQARNIPRVKHNHKDAILSCEEISYIEFVEIAEENRLDPYLQINSSYEQKDIKDMIKDRLVKEDRHITKDKKDHKVKSQRYDGKKIIKNYRKYSKYNGL